MHKTATHTPDIIHLNPFHTCLIICSKPGSKNKHNQMTSATFAIIEPQQSLSKVHLSNPLSSSSDFAAAIAYMRTPNTAFATKSATEYPTCSSVVAMEPARPQLLMM